MREHGSRHAASVFERLATWSYRRRWLALLLWVGILAGLTATAQAVGPNYHNDFSLPGTESQRALDTLEQRAPIRAGATVQIVLQDGAGLAGAETRERVEAMLSAVRGLPHVAEVTSPYGNPTAVSLDGTIGYATVTLDGQAEDVPAGDVRAMIETAKAAEDEGLRVELGGEAIRAAEESEGGAAEGAGLLAALVILVLLFGSLLAASLPIVIAIFAVGSTIGLIGLVSHVATVADFTTPLMILVGLGVGIDYALLVFSRYRAELLAGAGRAGATRTALDTAGRTVFFAACTVVIALMGLAALGLGSLQGVAVSVAVTVLVTMLASLTLLPALLAILGARIERGVHRRSERARARGRAPDGSRWRRWSTAIQRRPWPAAVLPALALIALAAPALDLRLGFADAGNDHPTTTSRQAYDLLAEGFGPGFNGPLILVVEGSPAAAAAAHAALADAPGIAATTPPLPAPGGDVSTIVAFPDSKPQDAATHDLVNRLRGEVLPPLARDTGATFLVGGSIAAAEDFADAIAGRLPLFLAVVVGLSVLLLMAVFRSLLIPVKAAVLNLLSVGGAMGVVTVVFQQGWLGAQPGPVEAFVPVMIFAIVFGLSMDYEVFLLARMHEAWEQHRDAAGAIREGLATTGRVVTAAGAIMVVVFGAFLLFPERMLQQFGLGLAVAIFLDAAVIRCLILPAVMQILGPRAWWLPGWLSRITPRLALERAAAGGSTGPAGTTEPATSTATAGPVQAVPDGREGAQHGAH
jgi:RND superfamily putative drug exporter